ncbi:hypothetical protein AGLY_015211 [Aphis glycines]|uniref:Endonuclease/exonuclease/phosphatase domain-containing protein n=1 Tax=Aphis glycines TaxID=307491 RepID=A0A6G0T2E9_APHGL|nr:hypothetical protein AGLY_015211 [Aphis glycines]
MRTLYQPGAALTLVKEFNKYSNRRQGCTGFIDKKNVVTTIKDFKVVNSRLTILIVKGKFFKIAFVNAHATSEDKSDEEKEEFYLLLKSTLEGIPRHCIIILLSDFNAKIDLKVPRLYLPYNNQIDHILVNERFSNGVLDVRTLSGAECGSDHFLVVGRLKVKLKRRKNKHNFLIYKNYVTSKFVKISILEEFGMPSKLISLIECSIGHTNIKVKVGHTVLKTVLKTTGLSEEDAMSLVLFNIVLAKELE